MCAVYIPVAYFYGGIVRVVGDNAGVLNGSRKRSGHDSVNVGKVVQSLLEVGCVEAGEGGALPHKSNLFGGDPAPYICLG